MVKSQTKYSKIAKFIKSPFDPATAKIIGGAGGLLSGLGIAGTVVAHGNLGVPAVIAVFLGFSIVGSLIGLGIIDYAARNSASLSTILFAMAGADFAGAFGAIAATACVSATNAVIYGIAGVTIDDMFADGIVASIKGVDQIIKDGQEAVASMPTKTKAVAPVHAQAREASAPQPSILVSQQVVQQQTQLAAAKTTKPIKTFTKKLEEAREVAEDAQLKR